MVVLPWLIRNFLLTGYIFFHTLPGGHFLHFSAARIVTHLQNCSYNQAKEYLEKEVSKIAKEKEKNLNKKLNPIEMCYIRENLAIQYFKKAIALDPWYSGAYFEQGVCYGQLGDYQ